MDKEKMEQMKKLMENPEEREKVYKKGFEMMDKDKKGHITFAELEDGLKKQAEHMGMPGGHGPTPEQKAEGAKILDPTGSGKIEYENFKKFMETIREHIKAHGPHGP